MAKDRTKEVENWIAKTNGEKAAKNVVAALNRGDYLAAIQNAPQLHSAPKSVRDAFTSSFKEARNK